MIAGGLFTREFLLGGVAEESAWRALDPDRVATAWTEVSRRLSALARQRNPNEAETEQDLIYPVLEAIGWRHQFPQQNMSTTGRLDVPDALLFVDEGRLEQARGEKPWERFKFGKYRDAILISQFGMSPRQGRSGDISIASPYLPAFRGLPLG